MRDSVGMFGSWEPLICFILKFIALGHDFPAKTARFGQLLIALLGDKLFILRHPRAICGNPPIRFPIKCLEVSKSAV